MSNPRLKKIATLPQASVIRDSFRDNWLENMEGDPRLDWHISRLNGIGGSEAVACYVMGMKLRGKLSEIPDNAGLFSDPTKVARDKLMINHPDPGTPKMQRGNIMEPVIIDRMLEQYPLKPRDDLLALLKDATAESEGYPWLRGTPDFVGEWTEGPNKGKVIVIDIKAPDEPHPEPLFDYVCQLHHYTYLAKVAKLPVEEMALASFDWKEFNVQMKGIPWNPEIMDTILLGGQELWDNHICKGEVPDWREFLREPPVPKNLITEEFLDNMARLEDRFLQTKLTSDRLGLETKEAQDDFARAIAHLGPLKGSKPKDLGLQMMGLTVRANVNAEAVETFCANREIDLTNAQVPAGWDGDAMAEHLKTLGEDVTPFQLKKLHTDKMLEILGRNEVTYQQAVLAGLITEGVSATYRTPKSGPKLETHEAIMEVVEGGIKALKRHIQMVIAGGENETPDPEAVANPGPAPEPAKETGTPPVLQEDTLESLDQPLESEKESESQKIKSIRSQFDSMF